jgi:hypothetical protein
VAILDTSEQPVLQIGHTASGDYLAIPLAELGELIPSAGICDSRGDSRRGA